MTWDASSHSGGGKCWSSVSLAFHCVPKRRSFHAEKNMITHYWIPQSPSFSHTQRTRSRVFHSTDAMLESVHVSDIVYGKPYEIPTWGLSKRRMRSVTQSSPSPGCPVASPSPGDEPSSFPQTPAIKLAGLHAAPMLKRTTG